MISETHIKYHIFLEDWNMQNTTYHRDKELETIDYIFWEYKIYEKQRLIMYKKAAEERHCDGSKFQTSDIQQ